MDTCITKPCVKNGNGEIVDSKLFEGLLSLFPKNRDEVWRHYDIATDENFLSKYAVNASYDANGEIRLKDYAEIVGIQDKNFPVEEALNKELQAGKYSYQEAIEKVEAFNSSRAEGSKYIATIRATENPNVFSIFVSGDVETERALIKKVVKGRYLNDKIIKHLASHGISVQFIEDNPSRYSTENATKNANGLYQLIQFNKNGTPIELAEEAGHFVIGAMGEHALVGRLENLVRDEEVIKKVLGKEYGTKNLGPNPAREIAGVVVGKAIANKLEHDSTLYNLAHRILQAVKKFIAKLSRNEIALAMAEAEQIAEQFAESFITDSISNSTKEALKKLETFYHRELTTEDVSLNFIIDKLVGMSKELKSQSPALGKEIDKILSEIGTMSADVVYGVKSLDGIITSILRLAEFAEKYLLKDIGSQDPLPVGLPPLEMAQRIQDEAGKFICFVMFSRRLTDIMSQIKPILENKTTSIKEKATLLEGESNLSYRKAISMLKSIVYEEAEYNTGKDADGSSLSGSLYNIAKAKMNRIASLYLEQTHGAEFITSTSGLHWDLKHGQTRPISFEEVTQFVWEDDNLLTHYCCNLANSKDIGAQLMAKAIKEANHRAYTKMAEAQGELDVLDKKAKKAGINDYRRFYTVDENGELTGNLVFIVEDAIDPEGNVMPMEIEWHKYERDYKAFLDKMHIDFINSDIGKQYAGSSPAIKRLKFQEWVQGAEAAFLKQHTVWSAKHKRRIPKISLYGKPTELTRKELDWFKEYNTLFDKYKSWIDFAQDNDEEEDGSTVRRAKNSKMLPYLAPQVRGSAVNTMGNLFHVTGQRLGIVGYTMWRKAVEFISREHVDINETAHHNWNTEENDIIDRYYKEASRVDTSSSRLLPLYYVSRMKDTSRLDTNLISATMQFVTMAAKYEAGYQIQSPLEVTREVLTKRDYVQDEIKAIKDSYQQKGILKQTWNKIRRPEVPYANQAIDEYVDALYYGMNYGNLNKLLNAVKLGKTSPNLLALAGKAMVLWYLGGNVLSAAINLLTGNIEIFKEAATGQHFDLADWTSAWTTYIIHSPNLLLDVLRADDKDKINLMAVKFNSMDKTEQKFQNYRTWGERFLFGTLRPSNLLMSGYSIGEHMMQNIPYIAMLKGTKLYTLDGEKTSLWKALEKTKKDVKVGNNIDKGIRSILDMIEPHFKTLDDVKLYKHLQTSISSLKSKNIVTTNTDALATPVLQRLTEQEGYTIEDLNQKPKEELINILKNLSEATAFNEIDESTMSQKAREVTNRMHGIYNKMDKTIFHRNLLGMLLLPFKGYAFGMLQRRYLGNKYNVVLGDDDEGSMTSTLKIAEHTVTDTYRAAKNLVNSIKGKEGHSRKELALAAVDHMGMAVGRYGTLFLPQGKWRNELLEYTGMNNTQAYNLRRTALDYTFIVGLKVLLSLAAAMATGSEDDDELDQMSLQELLQYCKEKGIQLDSTGKDGDDDRSVDTSSKLIKRLRAAQQREGYEKNDMKELSKRVTANIRDQIKAINKDIAEVERPEWNLIYYLSNRLYREQAAFNTIHGFNLESTSLIDPIPLSIQAAYDIYQVCSSVKKAEEFYNGKVKIDNKSYTIDDAVHFANLPGDTKGRRLLKRQAIKALNDRWENLYYDEDMKRYLYDKKKKGHHRRYDRRWVNTLKYKYNPMAKLEFVMHNGDQAVRDYNFGTLK